MSEKQYFNGLYGSNAIAFERGLINIYPFGVIGKQYNGAVKIHAHHNLLQLFLINSGTTELRVNEETIRVAGPSFIIIPKNMAHGFNHLGDVNGWIISLSDVYIEHMVQTDADILTAIDVFQVTPLDEQRPTSMSIYNAAQNCVDEYHSNLPGRVLMMQTLVGQMMVNLFRLKNANVFQQAPAPDTSSALLFRRFKQNIKASYSYKKTVIQYADDLKITSGYLNNICKSVSNQSPKDIIIDYFLIEARFLLLDPEKSINQVCYLLQFEDPAYFTRLFRKRTGTTPKEFRNSTGIKNSLISKADY